MLYIFTYYTIHQTFQYIWCFSRFLNCANGTKSRNASHRYTSKTYGSSAIETKSFGFSPFTSLFLKLQYLRYVLIPIDFCLGLGGTYPPAGPSLNGQYTTTSSVMTLYCKTYFTILSIFLHQCHSKIAELEPRNPLRKYNITIFCQNHIIMIAKCIFYDKNNTGAIGIIGSNSYELTRYCLIFHTIGKIGFCLYVIICLRMLFSVNLQITLFNMIITNDPFQHDHLNVRLFL